MNRRDDRRQHRFRTVTDMTWLPSVIRGLGAAGAAANARAELESAHINRLQAALVAKRVNASRLGAPLVPAAGARVA